MIGWEYPPIISGGLGVACEAISRHLAQQGVNIDFLIPTGWDMHKNNVNVYAVDQVNDTLIQRLSIFKINTLLMPYMNEQQYIEQYEKYIKSGEKKRKNLKNLYGPQLFQEVYLFALRVLLLARTMNFDIIHAHDWMTYPAAIMLKRFTNKPLVVHIHATEYDRTGGNGINPKIYEIEKQGFMNADKIIAVSNYTKRMLIKHYGIDPSKIVVVHNAMENKLEYNNKVIKPSDKIVLFVGRITLQKGPEYFIRAAKRVIEKDPSVKFIVIGTGDMQQRMIEEAARLGISKNVLFSGFMPREEVMKAYRIADLYVMPSVSEPFGLTALEAAIQGTPVIVSRQSGVSEVLNHSLKVDFWDIEDMAQKMLAVLHYRSLNHLLRVHGKIEAEKQTWDKQVRKIIKVYEELLNKK